MPRARAAFQTRHRVHSRLTDNRKRQLRIGISGWRHAGCRDFLFAVKGGRFITHMEKLRYIKTPLAKFFASGVLALRKKIGPSRARYVTCSKFVIRVL